MWVIPAPKRRVYDSQINHDSEGIAGLGVGDVVDVVDAGMRN